jgi:hypothetical protein
LRLFYLSLLPFVFVDAVRVRERVAGCLLFSRSDVDLRANIGYWLLTIDDCARNSNYCTLFNGTGKEEEEEEEEEDHVQAAEYSCLITADYIVRSYSLWYSLSLERENSLE